MKIDIHLCGDGLYDIEGNSGVIIHSAEHVPACGDAVEFFDKNYIWYVGTVKSRHWDFPGRKVVLYLEEIYRTSLP